MTHPRRFLVRMVLFLAVVVAAAAAVYLPLMTAFMANAPLNGLILGVFVLGALYNVRQVLQLGPELNWIEHFRARATARSAAAPGLSQAATPPRLLAPLAAMVGEREDIKISAMALRSVLDGIASRLDEQRDISRYTIGLLVFLGLLGTFWGLLDTLSAIRGVIANIQVGGGDIGQMFNELKSGLEAPLAGMGTAFSSSLFGLAGSLVLGFLDLQTGQAQNRFYTELEDWLSSQAKLSTGAIGGVEGEQTVPAYVEALLEQTAESLQNLQRTLARGEESRIQTSEALSKLSDKMSTITDFMQTEQVIMKKLAETHMELKPALEALAGNKGLGGGGLDDASRSHLRNIDLAVSRLVEETRSGREDLTAQIRSEIKLLARTVAGRGEG